MEMERRRLEGLIRSKRRTRSGRPVDIWEVWGYQMRAVVPQRAWLDEAGSAALQVIAAGTKKKQPAYWPAAERGSRTECSAAGFRASRRFLKHFPIRWLIGLLAMNRDACHRDA